MGEAKRRGTYAERKAEGEAKRAKQEEQRKERQRMFNLRGGGKSSEALKQWLSIAASNIV